MDPASGASFVTDMIANLGLPITIVVALGWFVYRLINRILTQHEENIRKYQEQLDTSQVMSLNHLSHVQVCMDNVSDKMREHDERAEKTGVKIVDSIEKQTDLIRVIDQNNRARE